MNGSINSKALTMQRVVNYTGIYSTNIHFAKEIDVTTEIDKLAWFYIKDKQLLAARSKGKDAFYIPGGKREPGESDEAALIREIKEELSIDLIPETIRYLHTFQAQAHGKPLGTMVKMTCYEADFDGKVTIDSEIEELCWIRHGDHEKCSPVVVLILDWLLDKGLIE